MITSRNSRRASAPAAAEQLPLYSTDSLHFSAWLICDSLLPYSSCTRVGRKIWFFFQDPENRGPALNAQWQSSNPPVPQKTLLEVLRMLRAEMSTQQTGEAGR